VIEDGVTGLLVEPAAPMVLAEAITALLRQPARLREMGLVGRERVRDRHTYLRMAADYAEVYRRVVDEFAAAQRISGGEDEP
jgi:glycosyltransferase involved in cell wall biosynthesis